MYGRGQSKYHKLLKRNISGSEVKVSRHLLILLTNNKYTDKIADLQVK